MVTTQGFNALLKIVEEPPEFLVFVFATTEPDKVLPTIRSRTHHYPFRLVPPATLRGLLEKICAARACRSSPTVFPLVVRAGGGSVRDSLSILDQLLAGAGPEGVTYETAVGLLGVTDDALLDETIDALAASDAAGVFRAVDRVVEAGHDPRRFATDLLDRLRDLIVLDAVPEAGGNGLLDCPPDRLDLMVSQARALGSATLSRMADIGARGPHRDAGDDGAAAAARAGVRPHAAARPPTARRSPRCSASSGSSGGCRSPGSAPAGRSPRRRGGTGGAAAPVAPAAPPREAPVREQPVREPVREAPAAEAPAPPAAAAPAAERSAASRKEYVRPSQARAEAPPAPASARRGERRHRATDDWPETARPGSGAPARPLPPPAGSAPARRTAGEPDIPLPPEPTDDEEWPHPAEPAAVREAVQRAAAPPAPRRPHRAPPPSPRRHRAAASRPRSSRPTPRRARATASWTPATSGGCGRSCSPSSSGTSGPPRRCSRTRRCTSCAAARWCSRPRHRRSPGGSATTSTRTCCARRSTSCSGALEGRGGRRGCVPGGRRLGAPEVAREAARAAQEREERELVAQHAAESADGPVDDTPAVDPEAAALSLLRTHLGARPVDS